MNNITELNSNNVKRAMLYKYLGDDGLLVQYSHGRMQWYRVDTGYYIDVDVYSYWTEA